MINEFIFREYDIRGVVDKDLTDETVYNLGRGFGTFFKKNNAKKVSVGGDVRLSTERFREKLLEGLKTTGIDIVDIGPVPTPVQYYSMYYLSDVDCGVMITGSHNPPEFNGFKLTMHKAPVFGDDIQEIKNIIISQDFISGNGSSSKEDISDAYIDYVSQNIVLKRSLKVVLDSGNGAASLVAHKLFKKMGVETIDLFDVPDGNFPNHHPVKFMISELQR